MYKLGIIGLSPWNGHPYSWSAIFNGYNKEKMSQCPFPNIPKYLDKQDPSTIGINDAQITHIWTQDKEISRSVAESSHIEHIVDNISDLIGNVDAVILARDDGENHLKMAKPFLDVQIPIFIDKPLTDNTHDLIQFIRYYKQNTPMLSCSSMRYANNIFSVKDKIGSVQTAHAITPKYWRTYGIHLIEGVCAVMGTGISSVQNVGEKEQEIVHLRFHDGRHAVLQTFRNIKQGFHWSFYGDQASEVITKIESYSRAKTMLL